MPILHGSSRIRRFVRDVIDGADGLDLVWAGDSNTGYNGYGWADGFADGLTRAGARMYATNAYTANNDYGTSGYRSLQWASMGSGSATYLPLQSSAATAQLRLLMGRGAGNLIIDSSAYDGGSIAATQTIQNEWAIWLYARGPDGTFTEPCPIGLDSALTWRGQVNIASGGSMKADWLTLANASLGTTTTFNTVSASTGAFSTLESTLPAGSRLATLTAAGTGIKVGLAGTNVGALNQITGPVRVGLHSVYAARKGYASNIFEWRGGATLSDIYTDITQAAGAAASLGNYLGYIRARQVAAGGTGRVAFCLQGGVNSSDWSPNGATGIIDTRVQTTLDAVKATWAKLGYPAEDLALVVMCSHPTDANDAALTKLRVAMATHFANSDDTTFVDLNAVADYARISSEGWYDSGGNSHLEELRGGYETMAATVVSEMQGDAISPQVSVAQIKTALKIDYTDDDAELERLRDAATAWVQRYTGLSLDYATRTVRLREWKRHCFNDQRVASIASVTYVSNGNTETMPADDYWLDDSGELAAIEFLEEPARDDGTLITVTYRSGYESLPREVVQAIISTVGHWYNNPEAAQAIGLSEVPLGCKMMLEHLRIKGPFS